MPSRDELPPMHFTVVRQHGVHAFDLSNGERVTAISQPSWDGFMVSLEQTENPGAFVVAPELITVSPKPADIAGLPDMVARRIDQVRDLSRRTPETTILLGSLAFGARKPRNQLIFIRNGEQLGRSPKTPFLGAEAQVFYQEYLPREQQWPRQDTLGIICSDLLFHVREGQFQEGLPHRNLEAEYVSPFTPAVRTLLVSSCWIAPFRGLGSEGIRVNKFEERRFVEPLRTYAGALMLRYPNLQDVVMADQLPPGVPASGPVNFHAQRAG